MKPAPQKWSRIWHDDAEEGTLAKHEGRDVVRRDGRWFDVEMGEEVVVEEVVVESG